MRNIALLFVAIILTGCPDKLASPVEAAGVDVGFSLKSMETSANTRMVLERAGWVGWTVVDAPAGIPPKGRPPFNNTSAEVQGEQVGEKGTLRVEFLNDRLVGTWFFPENLDKYTDALRRARPDFFQPGNTMGNTSIVFGRDYKNRAYMRIEDKRLRNEINDWIKRNA